MIEFDEKVFLWSLINRPNEIPVFKPVFRPEWLKKVANRAILAKIYTFYDSKGISPSIKTLREMFEDDDKELYETRFKEALDALMETSPDTSEIVYTLGKVRDVAIATSLNELVTSQEITQAAANGEGTQILTLVDRWMNHFVHNPDEESADLREAISKLFKDSTANAGNSRIPCGIKAIDDWTNEGLRPKQLGIIIAPTGQGKSALLLNIAYKIAMREQIPVWFVTNELTMGEQAERFLARITASSLSHIQNDPLQAYDGMGNHWSMADNIRVTSVNRTISAKDIEAMLLRWQNVSGWKPAVLVLDYMERMAPVEKGYSRDKEWNWLGAIAQDLVRIAKRQNMLIWSAAQTNRSGMNTQEITLEHAQGSVRHLQEAAAVIGAHQKEHPDAKNGRAMVFRALKLRHSKMSKNEIWQDMNLDHMEIINKYLDENFDKDDDEDVTLTAPANLKRT